MLLEVTQRLGANTGSGYAPPLPKILPVTLVPCPAFSGGSGSEVGTPHVHDSGGEAQQAAVSVGPVHPGGRGGEAVLLVGAGQQVEGSVLQVSRLLDKLSIQDEVRGSCRGQGAEFNIKENSNFDIAFPKKFKNQGGQLYYPQGNSVRFAISGVPFKQTSTYLCVFGFGLTFDTRDSCGPVISSPGTVDVGVPATMLDGHLVADAVTSTQNHLAGT